MVAPQGTPTVVVEASSPWPGLVVGGLTLVVLVVFGPTFRERFRVALSPGSRNLWADAAMGEPGRLHRERHRRGVLPGPPRGARSRRGVPTELGDADLPRGAFPVGLRPRLNDVADEERITVQLLPGDSSGRISPWCQRGCFRPSLADARVA